MESLDINEASVVPASLPPNWLASVTRESKRNILANRSRGKPRIQRVAELLRNTEKNNGMFDPVVVALGPFHHRNPRLKAMEDHKKASTKTFTDDSPCSIDMFYNNVREVAGEARECYAGDLGLDDDHFVPMMFFDACFLLHFIDLNVKNNMSSNELPGHLLGLIFRDMYLLENQIPFVVLNAVMKLKPVDIVKFVDESIQTRQQALQRSAKTEEPPFHLLDLVRTRLLGPLAPPEPPTNYEVEKLIAFRSATELNEAGIKFARSPTAWLRDVKFSTGFINGRLSLPHLVVHRDTKSRLLNLIAFELCPDGAATNYEILSYVGFLDCLIDRPEDVKELRSKGILLNILGSDEEVVKLFDMPDLPATYIFTYHQTIQGINRHLSKKARLSVVRMVHTHFSSPWTAISFVAAVVLLILTVIQTVFTVFPRK